MGKYGITPGIVNHVTRRSWMFNSTSQTLYLGGEGAHIAHQSVGPVGPLPV
jgi:hypothetical protein